MKAHEVGREASRWQGDNMTEHEIVKALVAGWEALPEGNDYPVDLIQAWLDKHIYPVVQAARELEKSPMELNRRS